MQLRSYVSPKNLVVASDLRDIDQLVPHVIAQARASLAQVSLVHAIPPPGSNQLHNIEITEESVEAQAHLRLTEVAKTIEQHGISCRITVRRGLVQEVVAKEIERTGATRLMIGTHAHGLSGQDILGVVANVLIKTIPLPIYVVGPRARSYDGHVRRMLHPVSMRGRCKQHLDFASALAQACRARLTLLHVLPTHVAKSPYCEELCEEAKQSLIAMLPRDFMVTEMVDIVVHAGLLAHEITSTALANDSNLIVMGIEHDYPWWSRSNSAAYQVISDARCAVLTLRECLQGPEMP